MMRFKLNKLPGLTLAELLIALALLAVVSLSIANFVMKSTVTSASLNMRMIEAAEVPMLLSDIRQDFRRGASISRNSFNQRLEYTTYDDSGAAVKKIYRITTISGNQYLQLSRDGGATWISPYRVSDYDKYILKGTPKFLYAWSINNCTDFADTNPATPDGVWTTSDASGVYASCAYGTSTPVLSTPDQASKVDLKNFVFSTGKGSPEATRSLPPDFFMKTDTPLVRSYAAAVSPAVKDDVKITQFAASVNYPFTNLNEPRGLTWDVARDRLLIVGSRVGSANTIYITDRLGNLIKRVDTTNSVNLDSVAVKGNGNVALALDISGNKLYQYDLTAASPVSPTTLDLALIPSPTISGPKGIAFDPDTPNDFYIVGTNASTSAIQIFQRNLSTGAVVGTPWTLPGALFTSTRLPAGLAIEPISGDFLVVRNFVNGSSPNANINIVRISRADSSYTTMTVNINDLGSSATASSGNWGIALDPVTNRIFLSDVVTKVVFQIVPDRLFSPRN
jgi:Tfp pilus assembly protein PilE